MGNTGAPRKEQFVFLMPACLEKFLTLHDHGLVSLVGLGGRVDWNFKKAILPAA